MISSMYCQRFIICWISALGSSLISETIMMHAVSNAFALDLNLVPSPKKHRSVLVIEYPARSRFLSMRGGCWGLLHDRLSHPKRALFEPERYYRLGARLPPSETAKSCETIALIAYDRFLSCGACLQPWDKNSYDLRHSQESTVKGPRAFVRFDGWFSSEEFLGPLEGGEQKERFG